jgi:hypothetical protein
MLIFEMRHKMKKLAIILLTFFYLVPVIGISVKRHYCAGHLSSVSLAFADSKCGCSKQMKKACCSDKTQTFKIKDIQQSASQPAPDFKMWQCQLYAFNLDKVNFTSPLVGNLFSNNRPPGLLKQPLFLFNQIFRI